MADGTSPFLEAAISTFVLAPRLEADSFRIVNLGLCQLRLMNDSRWPWLILVPQRPELTEIFEMTPLDQTMMAFELSLADKALKTVTGAEKINTGALGNIERQLHIHAVARSSGDPGWPGPVWGHGTRVAWDDDARKAFVERLVDAL